MVPINRRQFVATSGVVAIAGCLARGNEDDDEEPPSDSNSSEETTTDDAGEDALPESLATVLDPIPTAVEDADLRQLYVVSPDSEEEEPSPAGLGVGAEQLGLERADIDRSLTGIYGEYTGTIGAITGEFEAANLEEPSRAAASFGDGRALTASSGASEWEAGIEAAEAAADDPDVGVDGAIAVDALFGPIADADLAIALINVDEEAIPDDASIDTDAVEAIALGRSADVEAREETVTYVALYDGEDAAGEAAIEEILRTDNVEDVGVDDVEIETDGDRATTTFTHDLPPSRLPDNSPNVHFGLYRGMDEESVTLSLRGEESVDASNLEYRVDGEAADPPWDEDATLEPEERYEIDVPPMTHVTVVWIDPELEDVEQPLGSYVIGSHEAFEASYDRRSQELAIEYTVDRSLDPERLSVVHRSEGSSFSDSTPLSEYVDELDQGTEFVIEDATYGDSVRIEMDVDDGIQQSTDTVFWHSVEPPGRFHRDPEAEEFTLVYEGDSEIDATSFRVLVDDEPADAQWSDAAETLSGGERLAVDAEPGSRVTVEFVGDGDPVEVYSRQIVPSAEFAFDVGESEVEITHDGGDAIDAAALSVETYPSDDGPSQDAFAEAYDTVEEGDSITVDHPDIEETDGPAAVVVMYEGRMLDYVEIGEDHSGSDGGSGSASSSASDDAADD